MFMYLSLALFSPGEATMGPEPYLLARFLTTLVRWVMDKNSSIQRPSRESYSPLMV